MPDDTAAEAFITRWQGTTASELSTSQSFLIDLCHLLGVDTPHPTPEQDYMFERPITFHHGDGSTSAGRIDLYRRGAFVLESKKLKLRAHTKGFDDALLRARSQAENYARALPAAEGRPPFLRQLHDELNDAVLHAYGWGDLLPLLRIAHGNDTPTEGTTRDDSKRAFDEAILERLVALNAERAAEEARGHVRMVAPRIPEPRRPPRTRATRPGSHRPSTTTATNPPSRPPP